VADDPGALLLAKEKEKMSAAERERGSSASESRYNLDRQAEQIHQMNLVRWRKDFIRLKHDAREMLKGRLKKSGFKYAV